MNSETADLWSVVGASCDFLNRQVSVMLRFLVVRVRYAGEACAQGFPVLTFADDKGSFNRRDAKFD